MANAIQFTIAAAAVFVIVVTRFQQRAYCTPPFDFDIYIAIYIYIFFAFAEFLENTSIAWHRLNDLLLLLRAYIFACTYMCVCVCVLIHIPISALVSYSLYS